MVTLAEGSDGGTALTVALLVVLESSDVASLADGGVAECLARFEADRREDVEKTQHAADVSLVWFEHVRRFWRMHPTRFAFGLMTRSKAITWDNLALRAPFDVDTLERFSEAMQLA